MIPLTIEQRSKLINNVHDPLFKGAFLRSLTAVFYFNEENFRKGEKLFTICKEFYKSYPVVLFARKNFFLMETINEKILRLQAAGLIDFWHSNSFDKRIWRAQKVSERQALKLSHLSGCFILWAIGIVSASATFIFELVVKLTRTRINI
jgi:hypothetical protein